ncbi:hypothetical protein ACPPVV_16755 [Rhodanobacter sp. Col0626]|uniref:hypothetical protein n=1 Tax=Rhodanobacter sp. Col0626 TaxID=3415679 RepID=UPI003CEE0EBD
MSSKLFICIVTTSLLFGLSSNPAVASQKEELGNNYSKITKICEIRKNANVYFGKTVHIRGVYKTDHSSYSFIFDKSCSTMKTINVADAFRSNGDSGVIDFLKRDKEACPVNGPSVCPTEMEVDAVVKICKQPDGKLFLDFKKILGPPPGRL